MRVGWEGLGTENVGGKVGEGETVAMDVVGGKRGLLGNGGAGWFTLVYETDRDDVWDVSPAECSVCVSEDGLKTRGRCQLL